MKTDSQNMKFLEKNGLEMKSFLLMASGAFEPTRESAASKASAFFRRKNIKTLFFQTVVFVSRSLNAF